MSMVFVALAQDLVISANRTLSTLKCGRTKITESEESALPATNFGTLVMHLNSDIALDLLGKRLRITVEEIQEIQE
jgi:hypothetical protein